MSPLTSHMQGRCAACMKPALCLVIPFANHDPEDTIICPDCIVRMADNIRPACEKCDRIQTEVEELTGQLGHLRATLRAIDHLEHNGFDRVRRRGRPAKLEAVTG